MRLLYIYLPTVLVALFNTVIWVQGDLNVGVRDVELTVRDALLQDVFHDSDFQVNCTEPVCDGELASIYCGGPLLFAAHYFGYHQTCPGNRLKFAPNVVLQNFDGLSRPLNRTAFKAFCEDNFEFMDYLKTTKLPDWKAAPKTFESISDPKMKKLAVGLHNIWPELSREFVTDMHLHQELYPVLAVPNRFIVPGGRFNVYFYWDSYWIIKGLLFSELHETALAILKNFAFIIKTRGFIPNSGNIELSRRSQPPLFIHMLYDFYTSIAGENANQRRRAFLDEFLDAAEHELNWWNVNRTVDVTTSSKRYRLYQYRAATNCPRPENLLDDYYAGINSTMDPQFVWSSIASACESGLDFSVRWFVSGVANRTGLKTNFVVPVDLNVFMARNFQIMSEFYENRDNEKSLHYAKLGGYVKNAIDAVFYDIDQGVWFDYDLKTQALRKDFYPSNIFPLILSDNYADLDCSNVLKYLDDLHIFDFKGGIPSSLANNSKEQWDFPNAWAPAIHLFVTSLFKCDSDVAKKRAGSVANGFLTTVYNGLFDPLSNYPKQVWEKYDARFDNGVSGFGGEYPVQAGFGWTNGAVLDFIRQFYTGKDAEVVHRDDCDFRAPRVDAEEWEKWRAFNDSLFDTNLFTINDKFKDHEFSGFFHTIAILVGIALCVGIVIIYFYANMLPPRKSTVRHLPLITSDSKIGDGSEFKLLLS